MPRKCIKDCKEAKRLFKFPDRKKQPERWNEWTRLMGINNLYGEMFACQRHFSKEMYSSTNLSYDAVPDLCLSDLNICDNLQTPTGDSGFIPGNSDPLLTSACNFKTSLNCGGTTESQNSLPPVSDDSYESYFNQSLSLFKGDSSPLADSSHLCLNKTPLNFEDKHCSPVINKDMREVQNLSEYSPRKAKMLQEIKNLKRKLREKDLELEIRDLEIKKIRLEIKRKKCLQFCKAVIQHFTGPL